MAYKKGDKGAYKHGVRALEDYGVQTLDAAGRSRLAELGETVQDRSGLLHLLKERAARAILIAEMTEAWISKQAQEGVPFDKITLLERVTTFQGNAQRAINLLLEHLPKDEAIDVNEILSSYRGDSDDTSNR